MSEPTGEAPKRPVILAVDDDANVLRSVQGDLRRKYARDYRIMAASSGAEALDLLARLKSSSARVSVIVTDQRMPGMGGVELLEKALEIYPDARSVLLTAYADTEVAIRAINRVRLDQYILKPWDPPEDHLYPVLDDLLEDWQANNRPEAEGIRLIGHRWAPSAHTLRDFLARNHVPYRWLEAETAPEAQEILASIPEARLPVVVLPDGRRLEDPSPRDVADALGTTEHSDRKVYDLAVIGAGPAGLAAAVYGASEGLSTALLEQDAPGGQAGLSSRIENYLGFPQGVSGGELARRALTQARKFGADLLWPRTVTRLETSDPHRIIHLEDGSQVTCGAVILAVGVTYRTLDAEGVAELTGAGVYYGAATTEARAMKGEHVVVVGGANSAGQAAVHFAQYASEVTMLVRGNSLEKSMSTYLIDQIRDLANITVRLNSEVTAARGTASESEEEQHLEAVEIQDRLSGERETIPATGLFIFIGAAPHTDWLEGAVVRDERGFLVTGAELQHMNRWSLDRDPYLLETSIPGVFAVGDVRARSVKRVASAVGEGSIAVQFAHNYLGT
jgi:thioredoxin reductase (NADPH)